MKRIWVQFLVSVLLTIVITSGLYVLVNGTPEMVAVVLTLLVALAAIIVPVLVGWVSDSLVNRRALRRPVVGMWFLGISLIFFASIAFGLGYIALSSTYSCILTLLTR